MQSIAIPSETRSQGLDRATSQVKRFSEPTASLMHVSPVPNWRDTVSERNIVQLAHRYHVAQEVEFLPGSGIESNRALDHFLNDVAESRQAIERSRQLLKAVR